MASSAACGGEEPSPTPSPSPSPLPVPDDAPTLLARVEGDNLYVSFVGDEGYELCYWFCPTMENKLFSFHRVGYRAATSALPSVEGIAKGSGMTMLNKTTSDNIGPIYMRNGGWIGGNHLVKNTRTARTKSVVIKADDVALTENQGAVKCHYVTVDVVNDILDPSSAITSQGTFSKTMFTENVNYKIVRNSIDVMVRHIFTQDVSNLVGTYYGMQSMFCDEDKIMTPHGPYNDFTDNKNVESFKYFDYPSFNRFIEMNSSQGWCQASHLLPEGVGDHRYVGNNEVFLSTTYGKNYHVLIRRMQVKSGTSYMWHGVYSWFRPLVNDADVLVYSAVLDGVEAVYVDAKRSCSTTFTLPARWVAAGKKVVVAQADNGMTLNVDNASQVRLTASGAGTAILKLASK